MVGELNRLSQLLQTVRTSVEKSDTPKKNTESLFQSKTDGPQLSKVSRTELRSKISDKLKSMKASGSSTQEMQRQLLEFAILWEFGNDILDQPQLFAEIVEKIESLISENNQLEKTFQQALATAFK